MLAVQFTQLHFACSMYVSMIASEVQATQAANTATGAGTTEDRSPNPVHKSVTLSQVQLHVFPRFMERCTSNGQDDGQLDFDVVVAQTCREAKGGTAYVSDQTLHIDGNARKVSVKV